MQTSTYQILPKPFQRLQNGLLLELQPNEPPLAKKLCKYEIVDLEREKGYLIRIVKFNNKYYIYKVL